MPLNLKISDLHSAIQQSNARWIADVTNVSNLLEPEKLRRLGAKHPNGAAGLQQREAAAKKSHAAFLSAAVHAAAMAYPAAWDWRNAHGGNYVTPVRDQSSCGSCVAFGSIAAVESKVRIQQNSPNLNVDLSEAQLFYCDASQDHCNCETGWWPAEALKFLTSDGVADEACFPYTPGDQPCKQCSDWQFRATKVSGSHSITDRTAMKQWLATGGPLITCFTVYDDFFSYRSGVYHHVTGAVAGGHCVCVVGYDDHAQCWICKNSWGPGWGNGGFFQIAYGECGIDADMWAVEGIVANKVTLGDTSRVTPGLTVIGNNLVLAWTGTDNPSHLNVISSPDGFHFGGKITLHETSFDGPAIASGGGRVFIAWTGTDSAHHLNVMSTTDCRNFGGKVTLGDTASFGPALAYMNGHLYLAWVGTDGGHHLNVISSSDNGATWGHKVTLNENSDSQIGLCVANNILYLIWQGTDHNSSINFLQSTDGRTWTNKITLGDSSDHAPAAVLGKELVLAWTGRDSRHSLNRMLSTSGSHGFGNKLTLTDTATSGVALAEFKGKVYIAWGGTDSGHHLNVMSIPGA
jgi:C1A family cysteine protease